MASLSKRIPAYTKTVNFLWVRSEFVKMFPGYRKIRSGMRNKMDTCFWCRHEFLDGEMMGLVAIRGKGNKVICQKCVGEIVED